MTLRRSAGGAFLLALSLTLSACDRSDAGAADDAARAQALLDQKRIAEARIAIRDAIAERDDEPLYHILRGRIEFAAGSISSAYDAYSDAVSLDPSNMEALQAVSQLGLQTGNFRDSLEATETILSLAPDDTTALLMRGLHAVVRSKMDDADGYADRILAIDPRDEGGITLKARVAVRRSKPHDALKILERYGEDRPATPGIALTRLEIYRFIGDEAGLRREFTLLRDLSPDNLDLRIDDANFAFKDGRAHEARRLTVALLAKEDFPPEKVQDVINLWQEYAPAGLSDSDMRTISSSGSQQARIALTEFLSEGGQFATARQMLKTVSAPQRAALDAHLAAKEKRWGYASRMARSVLANDRTNCLALTVQAEAMLRSSNGLGATRSAQEAASQCPSQVAAWRFAAEGYSLRGDRENAQRLWKQGLDANPQNSHLARFYVAWLLLNGQDREALAAARRLTHEAPALLSGWRLYSETCERLDDDCAASARAGLAAASKIYGADLQPGQAQPNGLFGRIVAR